MMTSNHQESSITSSQNLQPFLNSKQERFKTIQALQSILEAITSLIHNPELQYVNLTNGIIINKLSNIILRRLVESEIKTLKQCSCQCDDWSTIFLLYPNDTEIISDGHDPTVTGNDCSLQLTSQVHNCNFSGKVVIGISSMTKAPFVKNDLKRDEIDTYLKPCIQSNTLIKDSIILPNARVYNNSIISNTFIGENAIVIGCGSIDYKSPFKDAMDVELGPEAGGSRLIKVNPENTMIDVCASLSLSHPCTSTNTMIKNQETYSFPMNIILGSLLYTDVVENVYLSPDCNIKSCTSVSNTILLPQASIENSTIQSVFMQWDTNITTNSNVSHTLLMERAAVGPGSNVTNTVIGPDSHVSCGEVHCSLIGPNTNSHHQSLLISVLWPLGRGNVGYGSNVGSNHTGRLPDQECTVGEGVFWGLGSIIKFPVDLSNSMYTMVAAGVNLPPQSIAMPFSLINSHDDRINQNEIVPGWLLHSTPYTLLRNEEKFRTRRKAKRHDFYCKWSIIRPSVIDACINARNQLLTLKNDSKDSAIYDERHIPLIGKNIMSERGRKIGILAYSDLIQRYALKGLLNNLLERLKTHDSSCQNMTMVKTRIDDIFQKDIILNSTPSKMQLNDSVHWPSLPWEEMSIYAADPNNLWLHQKRVLLSEIPYMFNHNDGITRLSSVDRIISLLKRLRSLEVSYSEKVYKSKKRDDDRGAKIIPNYPIAHVQAENDPIVQLAAKHARDIDENITWVLEQLGELEQKRESYPIESRL